MSDYIPHGDFEFNIFQGNLITNTQTNVTAWGILAADVTALVAFQTTWVTAFNKANNKFNRTSADVQAKDDARAAFEKALRNFVAQWLLHNAKVPNSERERMGIPVHSTTHTQVAAPTSSPVGNIDFSVRLQHTIHISDENSVGSKAKPEGVHGCEVWMKIGDTPPVDASELTYIATTTHTPHIRNFEGADGKKTVHYWLRWVNTTGKQGPWSSNISAIVAM